jgi:outer membrane protein assembly factor BamB
MQPERTNRPRTSSRRPVLAAVAALILTSLPANSSRADDWPQWLGPQRDGVWRETGILEKFPPGGPRVLWRQPIGGGYAGPAVADGKVYVNDRQLAPGEKDPDNPFKKTNSAGKERLLCFNAADGKKLWEHSYDCTYQMSYPAGPRATPAVADGKVYSVGAMGDLICLDAAGKLIWSKSYRKDYGARIPIWGFAGHPLIDGDKLICLVGGKDSAVVAFDRNTGTERWKALPLAQGDPGYCPPVIYTVAGRRQLIIWHPESVNGLDPETGKVLWTYEWAIKANLSIPMPRLVGNQLFLTAFYDGAVLLDLSGDKPGVKEVWRIKGRSEQPGDTRSLNSIMPTPFIRDGYVYGVCSYGELRCLQLDDGKRVWGDRQATGYTEPVRWANAFLVPQGDRFFLFNERGDLIIARLTPKGYEEIDRTHVIDPTNPLDPKRKVVWTHPAFAGKTMFVRNDREIVAVSLAADGGK